MYVEVIFNHCPTQIDISGVPGVGVETVTEAVPLIAPLAAVMVTGPPAATPVARPDEFTDVTAVLELVQVNVGWGDIGLLF